MVFGDLRAGRTAPTTTPISSSSKACGLQSEVSRASLIGGGGVTLDGISLGQRFFDLYPNHSYPWGAGWGPIRLGP
jgi:hypothetical protein